MWSIMAYFTIADALGQSSDVNGDKGSVDMKVLDRHYGCINNVTAIFS